MEQTEYIKKKQENILKKIKKTYIKNLQISSFENKNNKEISSNINIANTLFKELKNTYNLNKSRL